MLRLAEGKALVLTFWATTRLRATASRRAGFYAEQVEKFVDASTARRPAARRYDVVVADAPPQSRRARGRR